MSTWRVRMLVMRIVCSCEPRIAGGGEPWLPAARTMTLSLRVADVLQGLDRKRDRIFVRRALRGAREHVRDHVRLVRLLRTRVRRCRVGRQVGVLEEPDLGAQ